MNHSGLVAAVAVAFALSPAVCEAGTLYALQTATSNLYTINPATGAATFVANLPVPRYSSFSGLEYMNGKLYGTDVLGGSLTFGEIDPVTGAYTGLNNQNGNPNWHGLAGDASAGLLYAVDLNTNELKSITPAGVISVIGPVPAFPFSGMAFGGGVLYGAGGGVLYTLNTSTAVVTPVGTLHIGAQTFGNDPLGLAYDTDAGKLYMNTSVGTLYEVNPSNGELTAIGANGFVDLDSLAYVPSTSPVPEPSSALLLAVPMALLAARHLRVIFRLAK